MTIREFLTLLHPRFWHMNDPYNAEWDRFVRENLHKLGRQHHKVADIAGQVIWMANYPYGYGTPYTGPKVRPSRLTILRLRQQELKSLLHSERKQA